VGALDGREVAAQDRGEERRRVGAGDAPQAPLRRRERGAEGERLLRGERVEVVDGRPPRREVLARVRAVLVRPARPPVGQGAPARRRRERAVPPTEVSSLPHPTSLEHRRGHGTLGPARRGRRRRRGPWPRRARGPGTSSATAASGASTRPRSGAGSSARGRWRSSRSRRCPARPRGARRGRGSGARRRARARAWAGKG